MAKKRDQTRRHEELDKIIREGLSKFAKEVTKERGAIDKAAESLGVTRSTVEKMRLSGLGKVSTWIKLFKFQTGLTDDQITFVSKYINEIVAGFKPPSDIDKLFIELKELYSEQELAAWMKLLRSKRQIERSLGIKIRASQVRKGEPPDSSDN